MSHKLKLGIVLFVLGTVGVLSLLSVHIPLESLPKAATERFSEQELKWLMLINPMFLTILAILMGTALCDKVNLKAPVIESLLGVKEPEFSIVAPLKSGAIFGIISGIIILIIAAVYQSVLPAEFIALGAKMDITPAARLLYGGISEELLMRYGFMTLVIWTIFKISKSLKNMTYIIGILLSSLLFALGHLPIVFTTVKEPGILLISYIIIGNSAAGILFGWQYWKKGLEAAMIAHMFAHLTMMAGEHFFNIQ